MKHRLLTLLLLFLAVLSLSPKAHKGQVLGIATAAETNNYTARQHQMETITSFSQEEVEEGETIPYPIEYVDDPETEYGIEVVVKEGVTGKRTKTYLVTFWNEEEINRELIDTTVRDPEAEVVSKGSKIVWRIHDTPDAGRVWYWYKLEVWATKYDANCYGCSGRTYSGTEVHKGVCATDPRVIKLGTNFYVDGYGNCRAEDIGGAIKGNKIDLGFVDASKGNWGAAYTTIYLTSNAPDGSSKY